MDYSPIGDLYDEVLVAVDHQPLALPLVKVSARAHGDLDHIPSTVGEGRL